MNVGETTFFGILTGIIASVLTLLGERAIKIIARRNRLRKWEGKFHIVHNSLSKDTTLEEVTIAHKEGYEFSIGARKGPCGDWNGTFYVDTNCENLAHGAYRYSDRLDWGHHELLFDDANNQIQVYGINRSKPGTAVPFSTTYCRKQLDSAHNKGVVSVAAEGAAPHTP